MLGRRVVAAATTIATMLAGFAAAAPAHAASHAPVIRTMSDHTGGIRGQHALYITGDYLLHAKGVFFGSTAAKQFRAHGSHRLTVVIPTHLGGIVDVRVQSRDGTSQKVMADRYRYVPSPVVSSARPTSGPVAGGTHVTVRGANFREVVGVSFGNSVGTSIRSVSATEVTVLAPAHESGTVDVRVRTSFGRSELRQVARFTYLAPPTISTRSLPPAVTGSPYLARLVASDDAGTWAVTAGSLPPGLTLSGDTISGIPLLKSTAESLASTFTATYTDDVGQHAAKTLSIVTARNHWLITALPLPPDSNPHMGGTLDAVSCPTPGSCVATGSYYDSSGRDQRLLATLADGHWTVIREERPLDTADWSGGPILMSCVGAGFCVVSQAAGTTDGQVAVLATLSGGSWSITVAPISADATSSQVLDIDCWSVGHCVAVGYGRDGLIDVLTPDAGWQQAPDPEGLIDHYVALTGVSCTAEGLCRAVGDTERPDPLVLASSPGGPWQRELLPTLDTSFSTFQLADISCASAASCVAVGIESDPGEYIERLTEVLSNGTWAARAAPLPAGVLKFPRLTNVQCPAVDNCVASGDYEAEDNLTHPYLVRVTPAAQHLVTGFSSYPLLRSIACPTAAFCAVAGVDDDPDLNAISGLVGEVGTTAVTQLAPRPADAPPETGPSSQSGLDSVSCADASSCVAVGGYVTVARSARPLILTYQP